MFAEIAVLSFGRNQMLRVWRKFVIACASWSLVVAWVWFLGTPPEDKGAIPYRFGVREGSFSMPDFPWRPLVLYGGKSARPKRPCRIRFGVR